MSIVRVGSTDKYAAQWEKAFGKKTPQTTGAKAKAKKTSTAGKKKIAKKSSKAKKS